MTRAEFDALYVPYGQRVAVPWRTHLRAQLIDVQISVRPVPWWVIWSHVALFVGGLVVVAYVATWIEGAVK